MQCVQCTTDHWNGKEFYFVSYTILAVSHFIYLQHKNALHRHDYVLARICVRVQCAHIHKHTIQERFTLHFKCWLIANSATLLFWLSLSLCLAPTQYHSGKWFYSFFLFFFISLQQIYLLLLFYNFMFHRNINSVRRWWSTCKDEQK